MRTLRLFQAAYASLLLLSVAQAQPVDTLSFVMPGIAVEATRSPVREAPLAAMEIARHERVLFEPAGTLDDVLSELPGLWVNDRANASLGERMSIRGMGWSTAFGVRGVQVLLDGIPLTMPDGQAITDIVDPAMIRRAEIVRGPASFLWGNGSGGVLFLSTDDTAREPYARLRGAGGSDGFQQLAAEAVVLPGRHRWHAFVSDNRRVGYRAYSASRLTRAALHGDVSVGQRSRLTLVGAFADQDAENPGALTREQFDTDPRMADPRNINALAAKRSTQFQGGATLHAAVPVGLAQITVYGLRRDLDNPLTFAYVDLGRVAGGARASWQHDLPGWTVGLGADAGFQSDDRLNRNNDGGSPGTDLVLDQQEDVSNLAAYGYLTAHLTPRVHLSAGLRADRVRFAMEDRRLDNGDQTGDRVFSAVSPSLGAIYRAGTVQLYGNVRTGFETPTTTELVNRPDLTGGFNPDADPQRVFGVEAGARGTIGSTGATFDLALFSMRITDRLAPFQTEAGGDRVFYRNSGANTHRGVEAYLSTPLVAGIDLSLTYSGGAFEYDEDDLDGQRLPGIPAHRFYGALRFAGERVWVRVTNETTTSYFVDDANTIENDGYELVDVYLGARIGRGGVVAAPFVRLANAFDATYAGSVVVNATGGRYFEPASGRSLQAGLNLLF
jgi:iron complex outermembrane receptor protein